jgi:hypothetical protein
MLTFDLKALGAGRSGATSMVSRNVAEEIAMRRIGFV